MNFLKLATGLFLCVIISFAHADTSLPQPLVETEWLAKNLDQVVIMDVRTNKKNFLGEPAFKVDKKTNKQTLARVAGHIPNAKLVLYKHVRGDQQIDGKTIKHMAVSGEKFESLMQNAGVNEDSKIVITTNAESGFDLTMAARMYWQIKYYGHNNVAILNGGTAQWLVDGRKHSREASAIEKGNWKAKDGRAELLATSADVLAATEDSKAQLVDVRPLGQYLGTFKSSKAKASGHIPTAKTFPVDLLSTRKTPVKFSPVDELKQVSNALSVDTDKNLIAYCNSGHMASGGWFVFHELLANKNVKLYDGSMHQWTNENRPVVSMKIE